MQILEYSNLSIRSGEVVKMERGSLAQSTLKIHKFQIKYVIFKWIVPDYLILFVLATIESYWYVWHYARQPFWQMLCVFREHNKLRL